MMTTDNNNREVVIIFPSGRMEIYFSSEEINNEVVCNALVPHLPMKGKFSLYEWHNAHLEEGVKWRGKRAKGWSFMDVSSIQDPEAKLEFNPIAYEMRQISLGRHCAPVYGPVFIAVIP